MTHPGCTMAITEVLSPPRPHRSQGASTAVSGTSPGRSPLGSIQNHVSTPRSNGKENRLDATPAAPSAAADDGDSDDDSLAPDQLRQELQEDISSAYACNLAALFDEIDAHNKRVSQEDESAEDDTSVSTEQDEAEAQSPPVFEVLDSCRQAAEKIDDKVNAALRQWLASSDQRRREIAQRPATIPVDDVARASRRKRKRDGDSPAGEEDGEEGADLQLEERAAMDWIQRAHGTDWGDYTGSIKLMFRVWSKKSGRGYGTLRMPKFIINKIRSDRMCSEIHNLLCAKATTKWNKLTRREQDLVNMLIKAIQGLDKYNASIEKAKNSERLAKERNKRKEEARKERERAKKQVRAQRVSYSNSAKRLHFSQIRLASRVTDPSARAGASFAQQSLDTTAPRDRPLYSNPSKSSHLNDKKAREADERMEIQFAKTSSQYMVSSEDIDTSQWATKKAMLVTVQGASTPSRKTGPKRDRNIVINPSRAAANVTAFVPQGGVHAVAEVVEEILKTGEFDDIVMRRASELDGQFDSSLNPLEVVNSAEILPRHQKMRERRAVAEKPKSRQDIDADSNIGANTSVTSTGDFRNMLVGLGQI